MNSKTASAVVPASRERVFSYLSDIENLPKWATEFVQEFKVVDGKHKVVTAMGEMFIRYESDEATGVIDMYAGPTEDEMAAIPTRVVSLPGGNTAFLFTLFQAPDMSDEVFDGQFESLLREFGNIEREFAQG